MAFAALTIDLNAHMAKFEQDMARAAKSMDGLGSRAAAVAAGMKTAFGALGFGLGVGGIAALVKSTIDAQDEISKLSQKTGVAVETLAGLQHAANLSGVEVDQLAKGVRTFSVLVDQAANGQKSYQDKLVSLGLNYKQLKDLAPEEQFYALADAVSRLGKQDRAAKVANALGDRMSVLVPLLSDGSAGLRQLVEEGKRYNPVTTESAKQAEAFNDALTKIQAQAGTFGINVTKDVLPAMSDWLVAVNKLIERHGVWLGILAGIGAAVVPGITAAEVAGTEDQLVKFRQQIDAKISEVKDLENQLTSGAAGDGWLARTFFGSRDEVQTRIREMNEWIANAEVSLRQAQERIAQKGGAAGGDDAAKSTACTLIGGVWDGKTCRPKQSSGSKADPLAGLLGSTDIGRLRAFDKQVALLNQRFNFGKKDTELYEQAMTNLVKTTFANDFKQAADGAEFMNMVLADGRDTINESNQNMRDWAKTVSDAQRELIDMVDPVNALVRQLTELDKFDGFIDPQVLAAARLEINAQIDALGTATNKVNELDVFAKKAAENIQDGFANFFKNFDKGTDGMLRSFGEAVKGMIAEAAAADLARWLFGDLVKDGKGSGVAGALLKQIGGSFDNGFGNGQNLFGDFASLFGFATGGSFTVGGAGGTDSQLVAFRATPGEMVDVRTPGQARGPVGGNTYVVHVHGTNNAQEVRRAAGQGMRDAFWLMERAGRYV